MDRSPYMALDESAQGVGRCSTVVGNVSKGGLFDVFERKKFGPDHCALGTGKLATRSHANDAKSPQQFRHCKFIHVDIILFVSSSICKIYLWHDRI